MKRENRPVTTGRIRNISLGGVFLEMAPLPFGTELALTFRFQDHADVIECDGFVVWSTKQGDQREHSEGMEGCGVRLEHLSVAQMRLLAAFVDGKPGA